MATTPRRSRVFSISMPPEMAARAEAAAKSQNRTISELMREAFRVFEKNEIRALIEETATYAASTNPYNYTEEDVPRLIAEVRAEMRAEAAAGERKLA